jgi:hypothetical protein
MQTDVNKRSSPMKQYLITVSICTLVSAIVVAFMFRGVEYATLGAVVGFLAGLVVIMFMRHARTMREIEVAAQHASTQTNASSSELQGQLTHGGQSLPVSYSILATILAVNAFFLILFIIRTLVLGLKAAGTLTLPLVLVVALLALLWGVLTLARVMIAKKEAVPFWSAIVGLIGMADLTHRVYLHMIGESEAPPFVDLIGGALDLVTLLAAISAFWTSTILWRRGGVDASNSVPTPPQVAGTNCLLCSKNIMFATEGSACAECKSTWHNACHPSNGTCPHCGKQVSREQAAPAYAASPRG